MGRLLKAIVVLALLGLAGLTVYAFLSDLSPDQSQITVPVTLDAQ
ncbi:MAG: hypothetical protein R3D84_07630 [Paracoccaceae bacterium]